MTDDDDALSFDERREEARDLFKAFQAIVEFGRMSPATATMTCVMMIHHLDPEREHLLPFALTLLQGSEWVDDKVGDEPLSGNLTNPEPGPSSDP